MAKRNIKKPIGDIMVERGLISAQQLDEAMTHAQVKKGQVGRSLTLLGFLNEEEVAMALTSQYGFPYLPLENYEIDSEVIDKVPGQIARDQCLIPVDLTGNALTIVMADPSDLSAVREIELLTKCVVQACVGTESEIIRSIERYYHEEQRGDGAQGQRGAGS